MSRFGRIGVRVGRGHAASWGRRGFSNSNEGGPKPEGGYDWKKFAQPAGLFALTFAMALTTQIWWRQRDKTCVGLVFVFAFSISISFDFLIVF